MKKTMFVLLAALGSVLCSAQNITIIKTTDGKQYAAKLENVEKQDFFEVESYVAPDTVVLHDTVYVDRIIHDTIYIEKDPGGENAGEAQTFTVNGVSFKMMPVEGGTFTMGATAEQQDPFDNEKPTHSVTLSSYMMGETEVTQGLWQAVMGYTPTSDGSQWSSDYGMGTQYPAYYISWDDVKQFIAKLNQLTGKTFRMPTEAEWEYAARGGSKSRGYQYSGSDNLGDVAWYSNNSGYKAHPVKTKSPNELGLYDMSGNVFEWCSDWYGSYSSDAQTNPTGPSSGFNRVYRGGSWYRSARHCRVASRFDYNPSYRYSRLGFRLAL